MILDFLLASFLIVVAPLALVLASQSYLEDYEGLSEVEKTAYSVVPSVVFINVVIGVYIYRVVTDPENYKKDPPFVIKPKPRKND